MNFSFTKISIVTFVFYSCGVNVQESPRNYLEDEVVERNYVFEEESRVIPVNQPENKIKNIGVNSFWDSIKPEKVCLYVYLGFSDERQRSNHYSNQFIVNHKGKLNSSVLNQFTKELSKDSVKYVLDLMSKVTNYMDSPADCFSPRHGIVFYDNVGRIIGSVSICFECNRYISQPESVNHVKINALRKMFINYGFPIKDGEIRRIIKSN